MAQDGRASWGSNEIKRCLIKTGVIQMVSKKARKDRSDITVGQLEKKHGMPPGTIRNEDGRDTRADKKLGTIRKRAAKKSSKKGGKK